MEVRLGRPLDVISRRPQDVRSRCPRDVGLGRPPDDQVRSLENVFGTLVGDVLGTYCEPIFAGWDDVLTNTTIHIITQLK